MDLLDFYGISIHAPRTGSDACKFPATNCYGYFNPRSPHGERHNGSFYRFFCTDFNPRSPHGERQNGIANITGKIEFQSTLPARGATQIAALAVLTHLFQSTLPARGATVGLSIAVFSSRYISIHAPRTGSDGIRHPSAGEGRAISIHAPRTGSDQVSVADALDVMDFNPRSPHGERHVADEGQNSFTTISIHAPRTGSDDAVRPPHARHDGFQSTLPARGATLCNQIVAVLVGISIHAPRTGSDITPSPPPRPPRDFNPRSPHGERQTLLSVVSTSRRFQSTLPARGATYQYSPRP